MSPERNFGSIIGKRAKEAGSVTMTAETADKIQSDIAELLVELSDPGIDSNAMAQKLSDEALATNTQSVGALEQPGIVLNPDKANTKKSPWSDHAASIFKYGHELRRSYENPLRSTTKVNVPVLQSITDSLAGSIYHLSMRKAVKTIAARPTLPNKGFLDRNTDEEFREKVYATESRHKHEQLAAQHEDLSKLVFERIYFSKTRDDTFKALVRYANLKKGEDYVREEADGDHFRFFVTSTGFAKLEAMSDKDNTYNLSDISNLVKNNDGNVEPNKGRNSVLRAFNTLFCLHGDMNKFAEALSQRNGGFVMACIYRGPRTGYDDLEAAEEDGVNHIWEVEARHLHLEFMSVAVQQLRQKVRLQMGIINPIYCSPLRMKDDVKPAVEAALAIGAAKTWRDMSTALDRVAGNVANAAQEAEEASKKYVNHFKQLGSLTVGVAPPPEPNMLPAETAPEPEMLPAETVPIKEIEQTSSSSGRRRPKS